MVSIFSKITQLESNTKDENKTENTQHLTYMLQKKKKLPTFTLSPDLEAKLLQIEADFFSFYHSEIEKCN
jgi:hypothetical protein